MATDALCSYIWVQNFFPHDLLHFRRCDMLALTKSYFKNPRQWIHLTGFTFLPSLSTTCMKKAQTKQKASAQTGFLSRQNEQSQLFLVSVASQTPTLSPRSVSEVNMQILKSETGKKASVHAMFEYRAFEGSGGLICFQGCSGKTKHFKPFV